jgi:hypothetical protein
MEGLLILDIMDGKRANPSQSERIGFMCRNAMTEQKVKDVIAHGEQALNWSNETAAQNDAQAKRAKQMPCPGCKRMISNGASVCPHCGQTQWGMIVSFFLAGLVLLVIGYEICGPGFWRWLWWILGALLILMSISGIVESIRWKKES